MKKSPFKIYIERLKVQAEEKIDEKVELSLLGLNDIDLNFINQIEVKGKAYLASDHLILNLKISATLLLPCSICNEKTPATIKIDGFSLAEEISTIQSSIYEYGDEIRSSLLLKVPAFVECSDGNCPSRESINKYLKSPTSDTQTPFANLTL